MSEGGGAPPLRGRDEPRRAPVLHWRSRFEAMQRAAMRSPPLESLLHVMRAYDRGGGGMLAGALAYYAFFTLVPTLLLFVSLLGVLIEDRERSSQAREDIGHRRFTHADDPCALVL